MDERQHVGRDDAAVAGVGRDELALPLRVEEILPGPGRLRRRDDLGVVRDHVDRRAASTRPSCADAGTAVSAQVSASTLRTSTLSASTLRAAERFFMIRPLTVSTPPGAREGCRLWRARSRAGSPATPARPI